MPVITFKPDGRNCEAAAGTTIADAARQAGVEISLPCAGKGICGKCLVRIEQGCVSFENPGILSEAMVADGFVLACRSKVTDADITVYIPRKLSEEKGSFSDALSHLGIQGELLPNAQEIKPFTQWVEVTVAQPEMLDGLGDYDRFKTAVIQKIGAKDINLPLALLQKLPDALRKREGKLLVWYRLQAETAYIVDIQLDYTKDYGIAVDIGTTTVAVQLVDMQTGQAVDSITSYNLQIDRGVDIISRISYAKTPERIDELKKLVLTTINNEIKELMERTQLDAHQMRNASVAGNTTMAQFLLGVNPNYIRLEPYTPAVYSIPQYTAGEIGLHINPNATVQLSPNVGSYVGGDITSGLLCTEFALDSEEINLFIDIGTNGEIVFGNNDFLLGCACSAGPAFEGGGIEKGMRASEGAIETVEVDAQTGAASYTVIGDVPPVGICGSGLISLIAQLFRHGVIDPGGKFDTSGKFPSVVQQGRQARYNILLAETESESVYITEADIDNLIRAKAAIFSACVVLLKSVEMDFDCISKVYIAGGFGRYIDIDCAQAIGLLPNLGKEQFSFIGNSSLAGCYMTLLSEKHRKKEAELAHKITYIDLGTEPSYMDEYVSAMFLPHTDERLFAKREEC